MEAQKTRLPPTGWRDMTLEQLALLMRDFAVDARGGLLPPWRSLNEKIRASELNGSDRFSFTMWAVLYYLICTALLHKKEQTDNFSINDGIRLLEGIGLEDIGKEYNLDKITETKQSLYKKQFEIAFRKFPGHPNDTISTILHNKQVPSLQETLEKAFEWMTAIHPDLNDYGGKKVHERVLGCLDSWNGECAKLWNDYQRVPEREEIKGNKFAEGAKKRIEHGVKQIIFTGAPGTGKTYTAKLIAGCMGARQPWNDNACYTLVQFHPSYDYTDFVEGLRPVPVAGSEAGEFKFGKLDGHFKAFCRQVLKQDKPNEKYFFIIDEINRAELSKVFGELMYCLEADKRGKENSVQTQYQNLPTYSTEKGCCLEPEEDVFSSGFFIPANVIVIGTMNDIDRSVESMDFALRRRFEWMEAKVDEAMLVGAFRRFGGILNTNAGKLAKDVMALNGKIMEGEGRRCGLDRQYFISQGQFANLPADKLDKTVNIEDLKRYVWDYRIESLLREYLRGESEKTIEGFVGSCREAFFDAPAGGGQ